MVADLPGFDPPENPPPTPSPSGPPRGSDGFSEADAAEATGLPPEPGRRTSTRASTEDVRTALRALVQLVLSLVTAILNRRLAPEGSDTWKADEEDMAAIGEPLAKIAARHIPASDVLVGDVADGIAAGVGTANYALKNLRRADQERPQAVAPPGERDE